MVSHPHLWSWGLHQLGTDGVVCKQGVRMLLQPEDDRLSRLE